MDQFLGKGEVLSSILSGSTRKLKQKQYIQARPLPFLPIFKCEQAVNSPSKVGENWGSLFDGCSERNRATTQWRPPGDPENGSPGTVATATGAAVQRSVLGRTTPKYGKSHASVQSAALAVHDGQDRVDGFVDDGEHLACGVTPHTAPLTPLRAIQKKCLWCCNGSANEVELCPAKACPSWSFRFGHKPTEEIIAEQRDTPLHPLEWRMTASEFQAARHSALKAIKRKCLDCSGASKAEVRNCAFVDCALHIFRRGTNPNRAHSPEERARRAAHLGNVKAADSLIKKSVSIAPPRAKRFEATPTTTASPGGSKSGSRRAFWAAMALPSSPTPRVEIATQVTADSDVIGASAAQLDGTRPQTFRCR